MVLYQVGTRLLSGLITIIFARDNSMLQHSYYFFPALPPSILQGNGEYFERPKVSIFELMYQKKQKYLVHPFIAFFVHNRYDTLRRGVLYIIQYVDCTAVCCARGNSDRALFS